MKTVQIAETNAAVYARVGEACSMCPRAGKPSDCFQGSVKPPRGYKPEERCCGCGYLFEGVAK